MNSVTVTAGERGFCGCSAHFSWAQTTSETTESHGNSVLNFVRNYQRFPKQLHHFVFLPAMSRVPVSS